MITTYTAEQMIAEWRLRLGLLDLRSDSSTARTDGLDVNALIRREIDQWYLHLLDTADTRLLPLDDIALTATRMMLPDGALAVYLPAECRRVVRVRLPGWLADADIVTDPTCRIAKMQGSPWLTAGKHHPVAVVDGNELRLYTPAAPADTTITNLVCVAQPPVGTYILDQSLLETIKPTNPLWNT